MELIRLVGLSDLIVGEAKICGPCQIQIISAYIFSVLLLVKWLTWKFIMNNMAQMISFVLRELLLKLYELATKVKIAMLSPHLNLNNISSSIRVAKKFSQTRKIISKTEKLKSYKRLLWNYLTKREKKNNYLMEKTSSTKNKKQASQKRIINYY